MGYHMSHLDNPNIVYESSLGESLSLYRGGSFFSVLLAGTEKGCVTIAILFIANAKPMLPKKGACYILFKNFESPVILHEKDVGLEILSKGDFDFEEGRGGGGTLEFYQEEPNKLWWKDDDIGGSFLRQTNTRVESDVHMQRRRQSREKDAAKYLGTVAGCHGGDMSRSQAVTVVVEGDRVAKMKLRRRRRDRE
ncbi:hypothetical protein JHK86_016330 [Glycine max]|nr:hypothetical protein JHK86_016330 [Glycine max]